LLEASLKLDISQLSVVCEAFWPERLRSLGWSVTELGGVLDHPDGKIVALLVQVTANALSSTRTAYGIDNVSVLAELYHGMSQFQCRPKQFSRHTAIAPIFSHDDTVDTTGLGSVIKPPDIV
jgi:hypothetical protein